ncbi:hypothetical protein FKM82_028926 [Ascaphus truei]
MVTSHCHSNASPWQHDAAGGDAAPVRDTEVPLSPLAISFIVLGKSTGPLKPPSSLPYTIHPPKQSYLLAVKRSASGT